MLITLTLHQISLLLLIISPLLSRPATSSVFLYAACAQEKYQPNTAFETNLNSLLSSLLASSAQGSYNGFSIGNDTSPDAAVYGLYQCRGDLSLSECAKCVRSVISQIALVCPYTYGASLQLDSCLVRYEHADFLGKSDITLRHEKCGKSVGNDEEFFRRRDDVLAELEGANGFRVSRSGLVEGYAQCLGDLSSSDCSACLTEAVSKLKSSCGSVAAADVFLGQCYARYWASGYYDEPSDSSNEDQVGKTVAIIVGIVAGLAIFIVLLSMCRKAIGN